MSVPPASAVIVERRQSRPVTYSTCIDSAPARRNATPARRARRAVAGVPYGTHQPWTVPTADVYATAGELLDADERQGSTRMVPASPNGREHD